MVFFKFLHQTNDPQTAQTTIQKHNRPNDLYAALVYASLPTTLIYKSQKRTISLVVHPRLSEC